MLLVPSGVSDLAKVYLLSGPLVCGVLRVTGTVLVLGRAGVEGPEQTVIPLSLCLWL